MRRAALGGGGALLALCSALALAQSAPESLLPPGFDKPRPGRAAPASPAPARGAPAAAAPAAVPAVQAAPGALPVLPPGTRVPTLEELAAMSPDQLDELLGIRLHSDMPPGARRALSRIGVIAADEGGMPAGSVARQDARLIMATLEGNHGQMVSRWGHILLRRALASRLDAPAGVNPADFAAARAALLVRMGEGDTARALVQDVDAANYSPALTQAALDAYAMTADVTGICPVIGVQGAARRDADWRVLRAVCAAFRGDSATGMNQLDRLLEEGVWPRIDMLLAQKYAGAAGKARRAVKIEWDGVRDLTPWRYALTIAVGLEPPFALMKDAPPRYLYAAALAPMASLPARAAGADRAAAAGVLSSAAMVDLYAQIYDQDDLSGAFADSADSLRSAYLGDSPRARLAAIRALWDSASDPEVRYSRQVLTAYAAARLPVERDLAGQAADLIASMLAAGLDRNALRWAPLAEAGTLAWGQLVLIGDTPAVPVGGAVLGDFYGNDPSKAYRKSRFLLAGLVGLGRIDQGAARDFAARLGIDLARQTRWSRLIDQAAGVNNRELVVLLAGLGMQGGGWDKMTSVNLYHIVAALDRVGLRAEARMIAAEAVARG